MLPEAASWLRLRVWYLALKAVVMDGAARAFRQVLARPVHEQVRRQASAVAASGSDGIGLRLWN